MSSHVSIFNNIDPPPNLSHFFLKTSLVFLTSFIALEAIALAFQNSASCGRRNIYLIFEILLSLCIVVRDIYSLKKRSDKTRIQEKTKNILIKILANLLIMGTFCEIRHDLFSLSLQPTSSHSFQLCYLEFWLIAFSFALCFSEAFIRFPLILIQYLYFKYRTMMVLEINTEFFLENVEVFFIILCFFCIEKKVIKFFSRLQQELENYQTLFFLTELSSEGFSVIGGEEDILYSSPGFSKVFFQSSAHSETLKTSKSSSPLKISQMRNLLLFRELEEMHLFPNKTAAHNNSFFCLKPINSLIHNNESHLLINEGVDSEENLLLKLNRLKNTIVTNGTNGGSASLKVQQEKIEEPKNLKINTKTERKEKSGIFIQDLIKQILSGKLQEGTDPSFGISSFDIFSAQTQSKLAECFTSNIHKIAPGLDSYPIFKLAKSSDSPSQFSVTSSSISKEKVNPLVFDSKPLLYFAQNDQSEDFFSFFVLPFKLHDVRAVFISVRSLLKDLSTHYLEKIQNFQEKFMRTMSHELRTPINGSLTLLEEILQTHNFNSETIEDYLSPAICNLKIFHNTVNDIFDFSKLYLSNFQLAPLDFSLSALISEVLILSEPLARRKGLEIYVKQHPKTPKKMNSDPVRIRQILLNLLTNSLRFTINGSITIKIQLVQAGLVEFSVFDTGIGISDEKMKNLMKMTSSKEGTIGFGLTVSNLIAKELNLEKKGLMIHSKEGSGCCVSFLVSFGKCSDVANKSFSPSIPSYELNEKCQVHANATSLRDIGQEKKFFDYLKHKSYPIINSNPEVKEIKKKCPCFDVMIVDDNEFNLIALKLLLEKKGLKVDEARNGSEAIRKTVENLEKTQDGRHHCHYKLIFMDLEMPVKNGFEATEELTVIFTNFDVNIPIIACTAFSDQEKERCIKAGMNGFLTKPIDSKELEEILRLHLEA